MAPFTFVICVQEFSLNLETKDVKYKVVHLHTSFIYLAFKLIKVGAWHLPTYRMFFDMGLLHQMST